MIIGSLLLLSSFACYTTSTIINLRPTALHRVKGQCFTPALDPDLGPTNLKDCRDALVKLATAPDFTTPMSYSKNPRRGLRPLPLDWYSGDCLILVSCENERDAYTFRYADVLPVARTLVDHCVGTEVTPKWGLLRWGGMDVLGDSGTFYVSVLKLQDSASSTANAVPVELVNQTLVDPAIEVSQRSV